MHCISDEIAVKGYAIREFESYDQFSDFLTPIGSSFNITAVQVDQNKKALLASSSAMSLHTDHPNADLVCWYCVAQAEEGGASLLLDIEGVVAQLTPEQHQQLGRVIIHVPKVGPIPAEQRCMLSDEGIYYADWLVSEESRRQYDDLLLVFANLIHRVNPIEVKLRAGQALFINNKRILHGRTKITSNHIGRKLIRHWVSFESATR